MKNILFLTLVVAVTAHGQQQPCEQGHTYSDGCNTCVCSPTGIYACTRMICNVGPPTQKVSKRSPGCDKGEFYYDGCNRCVCQGQVYACTLKACFTGPQFPDTVQLPQPAKATISKRSDVDTGAVQETTTLHPNCDKGHSYMDDCNKCVCKGGKYACTRMGCYHGPEFPDTHPETEKSHAVHKRSTTGCNRGQSYYNGCNTCVCAGATYVCTARACLPSSVQTVSHAIQKRSDGCDKGESYNDGCNTCTCSNGVYACTKKACVTLPQFPDTVEATTLHPNCDKGHSYMDDCNTCVCRGGNYACTLMGCYHGPQFPDTHPETEKSHAVQKRSDGCDKGESYYDGCNTCVCSNGAYACTERACITLPQFPDTGAAEEATTLHPGCDKGPSYFDGCNTCTCMKIGRYACTKKLCATRPEGLRKRREVEMRT